MGELGLLSMLRGEFEAVVSMLMSVPSFHRLRPRPLNYFKYFQMSEEAEVESISSREVKDRGELSMQIALLNVRQCA